MGRRKKSETEKTLQEEEFSNKFNAVPNSAIEDLHLEIAKEHQRAEFQRLKDGWVGCGCSTCQDFYKTIDLTQFGDRVVEAYDTYMIKADPNRRDPVIKYGDEDDGNIKPEPTSRTTKASKKTLARHAKKRKPNPSY